MLIMRSCQVVKCLSTTRPEAICIAVLAAVGCAKHEPPGPALDAKDEPAWRTRLTERRAQNDRELATSPTSPMAGIARFAPTAPAFLAIEGDTVVLAEQPGPATLVTLLPKDATHWTWSTAGGVTATSGDGKRTLAAGELAEQTLFRLSDRFHAMAYLSSGTFVITAFDNQRKELGEFKQLSYFDANPKLVVTATVERVANPPTVKLATSIGQTKPFVRYATLRFDVNGQPCTLTGFRPPGSKRGVFIPFRDATSGKESYGAARFMDVDEVDDTAATVTLDFNQAYNPLCAYSPAYNCPLPPPENQLAVAITAGERTYGHH